MMCPPTEISLKEVYQKYLGSNRAIVVQNVPEGVGVEVLQHYLQVVLDVSLVHVSHTCIGQTAVVVVFKEELIDLNRYRLEIEKCSLVGIHVVLVPLGGVRGVVVPGIVSRDVSEDTLLYYFESKKGSGGYEECVGRVEIHQTGGQRHGVVYIDNNEVIKAILSRDHVVNGERVQVQPYFPSLHDYVLTQLKETRSPTPTAKPCQQVLPSPRYPTKPPTNLSQCMGYQEYEQGRISSSNEIQGNPNQLPKQRRQSVDKLQESESSFPFKEEITLDRVKISLLRIARFSSENSSEDVHIVLDDKNTCTVMIECNTKTVMTNVKIKMYEALETFVEKDQGISECRWKLLSRENNKDMMRNVLIEKKSKAFVEPDSSRPVLRCAALEMSEVHKAVQLINDEVFVEEIDIPSGQERMVRCREFEELHESLDDEQRVILVSETSSTIYIESLDRDKARKAKDKVIEYLKKTTSKHTAPEQTTHKEQITPTQQSTPEKQTTPKQPTTARQQTTPEKQITPRQQTTPKLQTTVRQTTEMELNGAQAKCFEKCIQADLQDKIRSRGGDMVVTAVSRDYPMRLNVKVTGDEAAMKLAMDSKSSIWHEELDFKKISTEDKDIMLIYKGLDGDVGKEFFRGFEIKHGCFIDVTTDGLFPVAKASVKVTHDPTEVSSFSRGSSRAHVGSNSYTICTGDTIEASVGTPGGREPFTRSDYDNDRNDDSNNESNSNAGSGEDVPHRDTSPRIEYRQKRPDDQQTNTGARSKSWHDSRQLAQKYQCGLSSREAEELAIIRSLEESGATADTTQWERPAEVYTSSDDEDDIVFPCVSYAPRGYSPNAYEGNKLQHPPRVKRFAPSCDKASSTQHPATQSDIREESFMINNTNIVLKLGAISEQQTSALVNIVGPSQKIAESTVSRAFCAAGGPEFERLWTRQQFESGMATQCNHVKVTRACGALHCDYVLHVTLKKVEDQAQMQQCLSRAMKEIFEVCTPGMLAAQGCRRIAMPPLGLGRLYKYPLNLVARCMVKETQTFLQSMQFPLTEVKFVVYDNVAYDAFKTVLDSLGGASGLRRGYSRADPTSRPKHVTAPSSGKSRSSNSATHHPPRTITIQSPTLKRKPRSRSSNSLCEVLAPLIDALPIDIQGPHKPRDRHHRDTRTSRDGNRKPKGGSSNPAKETRRGTHTRTSRYPDDTPTNRMRVKVFADNRETCTRACSQLSKAIKKKFLYTVPMKKVDVLSKEARDKIANVVVKNNLQSEKGNDEYILRGNKQKVKEAEREILKIILDDKTPVTTTVEEPRMRRKNRPPRGTPDFIKYMVVEEDTTPHYWNNFKPGEVWGRRYHELRGFVTGSKHYKVNINANDPVYEVILKLMKETFDQSKIGLGSDATGLNAKSYSKLRVIKIQRIENIDLYTKYAMHRKCLFQALLCKEQGHFRSLRSLNDCTGAIQTTIVHNTDVLKKDMYWELNEQLFFHGTKADMIDKICDQGLDSRVGDERSMFGTGVYGAESSTKADQYTDPRKARTYGKGEHKKMFLIRMALGNMYLCTDRNPEKYKRPPCTACYKHNCTNGKHREIFDSVVGDNGKLFREFVVYGTDHCYPEYMITYERV